MCYCISTFMNKFDATYFSKRSSAESRTLQTEEPKATLPHRNRVHSRPYLIILFCLHTVWEIN